MSNLRRALIAPLAVLTMLPFAGGEAAAAPADPTVKVHVKSNDDSVTVKALTGSLAVEDGSLVFRNAAGKEIESYSLNVIGRDKRSHPIDAAVDGNTATLVPSTDAKRSTAAPASMLERLDLLGKTPVADRNGYKSKRERDDAALNRFNSEMAAGMTISTIVGTAIGAVAGALIGGAMCTATGVGIALLFACVPLGATLGGIAGTVIGGGGSAALSAQRYMDTINAPFKHVRPRAGADSES